MPEPLTDYVITEHAGFEIRRRGLTEEVVRRILSAPQQRYAVRPGREVFQTRTSVGDPPKTYLVRVFVDVDRQPSEVVTAYRTSRIAKYWRQT